MKKKIIKQFRIFSYNYGSNTFNPITLRNVSLEAKTVFESEENALEWIQSNTDQKYFNGQYYIMPFYDVSVSFE